MNRKMGIASIMSIAIILSLNIKEAKAQRIVTYGIQLNPGINWLKGKTPNGFSNFSLKGGFDFNYGISGAYYINKRVAVSSGLQLFNYQYELSGTESSNTLKAKDSEGRSYERQVSGTDISESTSLSLLHIPVCLMWDYQVNAAFHLFAMAGPSFAVPLKTHIKASGTFTYKGFYPDGNYTLEDIPVYGFNSNVPVNIDEKVRTNFLSLHGMLSAGCFFYLNRYMKIATSAIYVRSLTPISGKHATNFSFSDEIGSFYSILESKGSLVNNFSLGITIQKILLF